MIILKLILLLILALVAIKLVRAVLVSKECLLKRKIDVNKTKSEVYDYLRFFRIQNNFSV